MAGTHQKTHDIIGEIGAKIDANTFQRSDLLELERQVQGALLEPDFFAEHGRSIFLRACRLGHTGPVKVFLHHLDRLDPEWSVQQYEVALQDACLHERPEVIQLLLQKIDPIRADHAELRGMSLLLACMVGDPRIVMLLLANPQTDPMQKNYHERSPLWLAAARGHTAAVQLLLEDGRFDPNARDYQNQTALHIACEKGHAPTVWVLLADPRTNPNLFSHCASTPLAEACLRNHTEVVQLLLQCARTNPNTPDTFGFSPLLEVYRRLGGNPRALQLLLEDPRVDLNFRLHSQPVDYTPIIICFLRGQIDDAEFLLARSSKIHIDELHQMEAVPSQVRREIILLMREYTADPVATSQRLRTKLGWSPANSRFLALIIFCADELLQT